MKNLKVLKSWAFWLPIVVVSVSSLFYVYEFFLRVVPAALNHELMRDFHMDARALGVMSALFYYGYTPMQIPAGLLGDRFGPRKILTIAVLICALAIYIFAVTENYYLISIARFFIGVASAFAFIGPLMLTSRWFHPKHFAMITGLVQTMGCVGAIVGGAPVAILSQSFGWRNTLLGAAAAGVVLTLLFWFIIRDYPKGQEPSEQHKTSQLSEMQRLKTVCMNPQTWSIGFIGFASWAPIVVFAALWGVPYFMRVFHYDAVWASLQMMWIWIGVAVGSPLVGWWSDRIQSRKIPLALCFVISTICCYLVIFKPEMPHALLTLTLFFFGFAAAAQVVSFGAVGDTTPAEVSGTAVGFNNMAVITGGLILQPVVGIILRGHWENQTLHGVPIYSEHAYQVALSLLPVCSILGLLATLFWLKETYSQSQTRDILDTH